MRGKQPAGRRPAPACCGLRVADARELWQRLGAEERLGPLDDDNPGMVSFTLLDPDGNTLVFAGPR